MLPQPNEITAQFGGELKVCAALLTDLNLNHGLRSLFYYDF